MTPPRVLVAEDEPAMLSLVARHLRNMGFSVIEASEGDVAWELAREQLPDLVILDVMMPGMSGWEICKRLKSDTSDGRPFARTGVIMLTGIGENLNEMTSPLFAADAWLNKPFDFAELDARVRETLARYEKPLPAQDGGKVHADVATEAQEEAEPEPEVEADEAEAEEAEPEAESAPREEAPPSRTRAQRAKAAPSRTRAQRAKKPGRAGKPAKKASSKAAVKRPSKRKAAKAAAPKRGAASKKAGAKKATPKRGAASKKAGAKKAAPKRAAASKRASAKSAAPKRASAKKTASKRAAAPKRASTKKAAPKRGAAKKAPARKRSTR